MSKRRQPPSPAVESPSVISASTPTKHAGKRLDQRPSPASAAAAGKIDAGPQPADAKEAAALLSDAQQAFLSGFDADSKPPTHPGRPSAGATPNGKSGAKAEGKGASPDGSVSGDDSGGSENGDGVGADGKKGRRRHGPGSKQELLGMRGGGRWTKEEDDKLRAGVSVVGPKNWKRISDEFLGAMRSDVQCLHRWQKVLRPGLVKGAWTTEEDETVIRCIQAGITKWSEIAERVPGRIGKQCRERWFNHLDPSIKKGGWTEEEDRILIEQQAKIGNRWNEIAKLIPGRTENSVKNRWNSAMRRDYQAKHGVGEGGGGADGDGGEGGEGGGGKLTRHKSLASLGSDAPHQRMRSLDDLQAKARMLAVPGSGNRPPTGLAHVDGAAGRRSEPVSARDVELMYRAYLGGVAHSRPDTMPHPRGLMPSAALEHAMHSSGEHGHSGRSPTAGHHSGAHALGALGGRRGTGPTADHASEALQWDFHASPSASPSRGRMGAIGQAGVGGEEAHSLVMQRMKDELFGGALAVEEHRGGHGGGVLHELDLNPPRSRPGSRSAMRRGSGGGGMGGMVYDDEYEYDAISTPPDGLSQSMLEMSLDEDHAALQISPTGGSSDGLLHAALASMSSPGSMLADDGKRVLQAAFEADGVGGSGGGHGEESKQQLSPTAESLHKITSIFKMGGITSEEKGLLKDVLLDRAGASGTALA